MLIKKIHSNDCIKLFNVFKSLKQFYNYFLTNGEDREFTRRLRSILGYTPSNLDLYKLAFFHKSNGAQKGYAIQNNERLEYLGDAVLGTIIFGY